MEPYTPAGFCPRCGYRLDAGRCPECGRAVPRPSLIPPLVRRRRLIQRTAILTVLIVGFVALYGNRDELAVRFAATSLIKRYAGFESQFARWCRHILDEQCERAMSAEESAGIARRVAIEQELGGIDSHEWAGRYESSHEGLLAAPVAGFVFAWSGCEDAAQSHGDVAEVTADRIVLRSPPSIRSFDIEPRRLLRVQWQGHKYLIPEAEVVEFANHVNSREGGAPFWHLHRVGDRTQPEPKLPRLPEPFDGHIRKEPLNANVVRVNSVGRSPDDTSGKCWEAEIVLNVGTADGVFMGMKFFATHRDTFLGANVVKLGDHESTAEFVDCFDENEELDMPQIGWRLSTLGPFVETTGENFDLRELDLDDMLSRDDSDSTSGEGGGTSDP